MKPLGRYSERFPPSGGLGAYTARRALGTPRVGFWELFLRETLQNSWDARAHEDEPIAYGVHLWTATGTQRALLRDVLLADTPPRSALPEVLRDSSLTLMVVADSGTRGLSGPTRADIGPESVPDAHTDFVDLVRDTGRRAAKGLAGGTYGFGKAVLPAASAASTVVIYSRTISDGTPVSRLIAMAVDNDEYTHRRLRYTGRHWWGVLRGDVVEPVEGRDADTTAAALGMKRLIGGPTGTAIMVVSPRSADSGGTSDPAGIVAQVADAAVEYAWPHMVPGPGRRPSIDFAFTCDGHAVPVRDPTADPRLRTLAGAYARCVELVDGTIQQGDDWPWYLRTLRSGRPDRQLGALAWRHHGAIGHPAGPEHDVRSEIALLRAPRFVVSYMDVPRHPSGQSTYGVFLAEPDLDHEFATAEPPTHDEWVPIQGRYGDPIRRSLKRIVEELRPRPSSAAAPSGRIEPSVVHVASALGGLLHAPHGGGDPRVPLHPEPWPGHGPDVVNAGADPTPVVGGTTTAGGPGNRSAETGLTRRSGDSPPSTGSHPVPPAPESVTPPWAGGRPRVQPDGEPRLSVHDGRTVVEFPFVVHKPHGSGDLRITARPDVFIDGGRESEPPAGADVPSVIEWRDLVEGSVYTQRDLTVAADGGSRWAVVISQPADAAVTVGLSVGRP